MFYIVEIDFFLPLFVTLPKSLMMPGNKCDRSHEEPLCFMTFPFNFFFFLVKAFLL